MHTTFNSFLQATIALLTLIPRHMHSVLSKNETIQNEDSESLLSLETDWGTSSLPYTSRGQEDVTPSKGQRAPSEDGKFKNANIYTWYLWYQVQIFAD